MERGAAVARETDRLVTFGVEPTRAEPGYGYIELGEERGDWHELAAFHEKPDRETARQYLERGHRWNAGIFAWRPEAFLSAVRDSPLSPLLDALERGNPEAGFDAISPRSVDRAVMERTANAAVVPASFAWDDVGAWDAFARRDGDDDGNVTVGEVDELAIDASNNVVAADGVEVSLVGVSDLAVVAWDDRVLVVPTADAQRVREVARRRAETEE